ncbi:unnamed protein product [Cuscuta europaea]|uniref:Uncharacterized protein n=1 Tax=Cuscuta europaea TaxID=41803 RepID=A0A9P1ENJ0_CUSEU|nr:unnamed protein product [Cuscuta europaea]
MIPPALTAESIQEHKRVYEQWERSNRMSLMIIKNSISVAIRGAIPDSDNEKTYLDSVEEQFKGTSKAHASTYHGMLLMNLIKGLKIVHSISRPLKIYCDNSAAVSFSNGNSSSGAGLYLDTKFLFVRERVEENNLSIEYISTHDMLADPMTKGLPPKNFQEHVLRMGFSRDLT